MARHAALALAGLLVGVPACSPQPDQKAVDAQAAAAVGPRPQVTVHDLMLSLVDPSADALWQSVRTVTTIEEGERQYRPTTDADWMALRTSAVALVEAPMLLTTPGRQVIHTGKAMEAGGTLTAQEIQQRIDSNPAAWAGMARGLQMAALEMLAAIDARDADRLFESGEPLDTACEACHVQYWYPTVPKPAAK